VSEVNLTHTTPGDLLATYQPQVTKKPRNTPEVAKKPRKKRATKAEMAARAATKAALATSKAEEKVGKVATVEAAKPGMRQSSPFSISSLESDSSDDKDIS
jgi:hypothetical protein